MVQESSHLTQEDQGSYRSFRPSQTLLLSKSAPGPLKAEKKQSRKPRASYWGHFHMILLTVLVFTNLTASQEDRQVPVKTQSTGNVRSRHLRTVHILPWPII